MSDLKPCPFCNNKNLTIWRVCGSLRFYVECGICHWCGKTKLFKFRAKRAWNRRAGE